MCYTLPMNTMQAVDVKAIKRWVRENVPFSVCVNRYRKYQVCVEPEGIKDFSPYAERLIAALGLTNVTKLSRRPGMVTSLEIIGGSK